MPAGRPPAGPQIVAKYEGSRTAKQRLEAVLETVAGQATVDAASDKLGICPARFYVLRDRAMAAALDRLEPRAGGRPRKRVSPEGARVKELEAEVTRLNYELAVAEARAETALLLPRRSVGHDAATSKKRALQRHAPRGRRKGARSRR